MTESPLSRAVDKAYTAVRDRSHIMKPSRWQSMDVSKRLEATTLEVLNYTLQAPVPEELSALRDAVKPNLPWADDHFLERVGGRPLNPGVEWAHWPWGNSANSFRRVDIPGQDEKGFDHTYMERMWPKNAGMHVPSQGSLGWREGVRFKYGDAGDVVEHLLGAPDSRQAFLPIWFPEDTGKLDVRVPCTIGYHFIQRHGYLHCVYYIRSCDLYRHFRDDVYLTARLQLWVLDKLRAAETMLPQTPLWADVKPGLLTMHITSLHCFVNDARLLWPDKQVKL